MGLWQRGPLDKKPRPGPRGRRLARSRGRGRWRGRRGLLRRAALRLLPHHLVEELAAAARMSFVTVVLVVLSAVRRGRLGWRGRLGRRTVRGRRRVLRRRG